MNKKQLIVAWVMGGLISYCAIGLIVTTDNYVQKFIGWTIPTLIIGTLLIYTLRDKKK